MQVTGEHFKVVPYDPVSRITAVGSRYMYFQYFIFKFLPVCHLNYLWLKAINNKILVQ